MENKIMELNSETIIPVNKDNNINTPIRVTKITPEDINSPKSYYEALFYNVYFEIIQNLNIDDYNIMSLKLAKAKKSMQDYLYSSNENNIYKDLKKYTGKDFTKKEIMKGIEINRINQNIIETILTQCLNKQPQI